jgi:hypothetical protein
MDRLGTGHDADNFVRQVRQGHEYATKTASLPFAYSGSREGCAGTSQRSTMMYSS